MVLFHGLVICWKWRITAINDTPRAGAEIAFRDLGCVAGRRRMGRRLLPNLEDAARREEVHALPERSSSPTCSFGTFGNVDLALDSTTENVIR